MKKEAMKALLNKKENMRQLLYPRGFLLTNDMDVSVEQYPFYSLWQRTQVGEYQLFIHPKQRLALVQENGISMALVGHAYNPMDGDNGVFEEDLLKKALQLYKNDTAAFTQYFNQWTGLFVLCILQQDTVRLYGDAAGMYTVYYGTHNGKIYCSSHTNLLGDICNLTFDSYVQRLINYRFYYLFGKYLPGDISPYKEFKRLIPNHYGQNIGGKWEIIRFFPTQDNALYDLPYEELIDRSAQILSRGLQMIYKKWKRPAISLTGGCDSKTTLSCTNGVYDRYSYFSYTSSDSESVDAEAAKSICALLDIPHKIYQIPNSDDAYEDIEDLRQIMEYNSGSIGKNNANDVRKRAFFLGTDDFDVEVKSWASEIARSYYCKRFAKKKFPKKLTPRYATCLYKVFITDRKLVRDTDRVFEEFLNTYYSDGSFKLIPWQDLFFWEFRMSSWNGLVITGEQQIAYDIAIPYNNRVMLQLLLSTPEEKRIQDQPHWDIMRKMNPEIYNCGISVVNVKHTNLRAKVERLYLEICSKIPF